MPRQIKLLILTLCRPCWLRMSGVMFVFLLYPLFAFADGRLIAVLKHEPHCREVVFHDSERHLSVLGTEGATTWSIASLAPFRLERKQVKPVGGIFSLDGKIMVGRESEAPVKAWRMPDFTEIAAYIEDFDPVAISHDNDVIVGWPRNNNSRELGLWRISTSKKIDGRNFQKAYSPHAGLRRVAFCCSDKCVISIWGINHLLTPSKMKVFSVKSREPEYNSIANTMKNPDIVEPAFDGKTLAVGYPGPAPYGKAVIWDTQNWKTLGEFRLAAYANIQAMAFSRRNSFIALGGDCYSIDQKGLADLESPYYDVKLFHIVTKKCVATLKGHTDAVRCIAFSPDGNLLVCGCQDGSVRIWDISSIKMDMNEK